jgi:hypothetical protein
MPNSEVIQNKNELYTEYVLQDSENTTQSQQYYHHMHTTRGLSNSNTSLLLFIQHIKLQHKTCTDCQVWGSHSRAAEDSSLLGCDTVSSTSISWCFKSATTHLTTRCHNPEGLNIVALLIRRHMGHKATNVQEQQGNSHLKHNSLISTIPWLPFLASTQCHFSLTYLLWPPLGVLALHSLFLYSDQPPSPSPSFQLAQAIFEPISRINTPTISTQLFFLLTPPMKMEQKECSETSAYKIQTPGNHPKERI